MPDLLRKDPIVLASDGPPQGALGVRIHTRAGRQAMVRRIIVVELSGAAMRELRELQAVRFVAVGRPATRQRSRSVV
jgi:hypothetical protein